MGFVAFGCTFSTAVNNNNIRARRAFNTQPLFNMYMLVLCVVRIQGLGDWEQTRYEFPMQRQKCGIDANSGGCRMKSEQERKLNNLNEYT